jgi:hypothetical protein
LDAVFWLTFLAFTPSILSSLGADEVAGSVNGIISQVVNYVPGIIGAVIILIVGALLARILRQIVTGFLEGVGVDRLGERVGLSVSQKAQPLSALLGTVVYVLVMITIVVQALQTLSLPASARLHLLNGATSAIFGVPGAAVILGVPTTWPGSSPTWSPASWRESAPPGCRRYWASRPPVARRSRLPLATLSWWR